MGIAFFGSNAVVGGEARPVVNIEIGGSNCVGGEFIF